MTQSTARETTYVVTAAPRQRRWCAMADYKAFTVPLRATVRPSVTDKAQE